MTSAASAANAVSPSNIRQLIADALPDVIRIRHDLHTHPELAYQEKRTSRVVCEQLTKLGVKHVSGLAGGTGVVAYIPPTVPGAESRGSIGLRADMDALPITETTGVAYASKTPGIMHACGHDGHTANLLGVAAVLSKLAHRPNAVTLVFQPAEEGGAGGKKMCEDGVLDGSRIGPKVRAMFGLHGWPQYTVGIVGTKPGPMLAATDNFQVVIGGTQSHAAYPQLSNDPIVACASVINALQTIASRNIAPQDSIVLSITTIKGGVANNVIPQSIQFGGTMRTLKPETRVLGKKRFYQIVEQTASALGCTAEITWHEGYPVTFNDPGATDTFFKIARTALGDARVQTVPYPSLGGEDFSYYGHHVPACFFILGVKPEGRDTYPTLHQPDYDFNDDALVTGMELMVGLATEVQ
jgi:amidohydrolase